MHDIVIRRGTLIDGTGAPRRIADIAIDAGHITAVGGDIGPGRREVAAEGLLVTPGFVDIHTHYDGQATHSLPRPRCMELRPRSSVIAASDLRR
jgi:N-acyl-D-amino-acid deacylase